MSNNNDIQALRNEMNALNSRIEALITVTIEEKAAEQPYINRRGRINRDKSLAASVSDDERAGVDNLCKELLERNGWKLTRSGLLRVAWLHFKDHHETYDLEPYMDEECLNK